MNDQLNNLLAEVESKILACAPENEGDPVALEVLQLKLLILGLRSDLEYRQTMIDMVAQQTIAINQMAMALTGKEGRTGSAQDGDTINDMEFNTALKHFIDVQSAYIDLIGVPGVSVGFALMSVFSPLARRIKSGERSRKLYKELMALEA